MLGKHRISAFLGIENFCDSAPLDVAIRMARLHGFGPVTLAVTVRIYLTPRIITADGCKAEGVMPDGGFVAGCRFASVLTRDLLY